MVDRNYRKEEKEIDAYLSRANKDELVQLLKAKADADPTLRRRLSSKALVSSERPADIKEHKRIIREALGRNEFVHYRSVSEHTNRLEEAAAGLKDLAQAGHPREAADLIEFLIDGASKKIEQLDDSDGIFSGFIRGLYDEWGRVWSAIQDRDPIKLAENVLQRLDDNNYGLADDLIPAMASALGDEGLNRLERSILPRYEKWRGSQNLHKENPKAYLEQSRALRALLDIADASKDVDRFIELKKESGLQARDLQEIAERLKTAGRLEEALYYVEQGLSADRFLGSEGYDLPRLKIEILKGLKRLDDARSAAWEFFRSSPMTDLLESFLSLTPKGERERARTEALDYCSNRSDLSRALGFFMDEKEYARLAEMIRRRPHELRKFYYATLLPVTDAMEEEYPNVAIMIYRFLGFQILKDKRSKAYRYAADHFRKVKKLYTRIGKQMTWDRLKGRIATKHRLKSAFMAYFNKIPS